MEGTAHYTFEVSSENKADYIGLGTFLVFNNVLKKQRHLVFCTLAWLSFVIQICKLVTVLLSVPLTSV